MTQFPSFYPTKVDHMTWGPRDRHSVIATEAARIKAADGVLPLPSYDGPRIELLGIDLQNDFCHPAGALYVGGRDGRGGVEDTYRLARHLYANVANYSRVTATLDTHVPGQVFFTSFWVDAKGNEPAPFTLVSLEDILIGRLRPSPAALAAAPDYLDEELIDPQEWVRAQVEHYVEALAASGRYSLILWPYHCLLGTEGHALARPFLDAALYHSMVRSAPFIPVPKGDDPWTESYSVFRNEVDRDVKGRAIINRAGLKLADRLVQIDNATAVVVAGQASSHCVKSSVDDLIEFGVERDSDFPSRLYVLRDCMSAVVTKDADGKIIEGLDFTESAEAAIARWDAAGVNIVESTVPMSEWPGMSRILSRDDAPGMRR